jgi:hypothetical protein
MNVFVHRFDSTAFRNAFAPRKPRRPWARVLLGLVGVGVLVALVFVSVFVGIAMLTVGLLLRLARQRGKPVARDARTLDGEYRVVRKHALPSA